MLPRICDRKARELSKTSEAAIDPASLEQIEVQHSFTYVSTAASLNLDYLY
jgi:hypothetical protein